MSETEEAGAHLAMTRSTHVITSSGATAIKLANTLIDLLDYDLSTHQKLFMERIFRFDEKFYASERVELYQLISLLKSAPGVWRVTGTQEERDFTPSAPPVRKTLVKVLLATEGLGYNVPVTTATLSFCLEGGHDIYTPTQMYWKINDMEGTIKIKTPLNVHYLK